MRTLALSHYISLYINDITAYIPESSLSLYADDTALIATEKDHCVLKLKLQNYTDYLGQWCVHNRLIINVGKSNVMYFGEACRRSKSAAQLPDNVPITLDNEPFGAVSHYKYLGFIFDDCLIFKPLFENTIRKLNHVLSIFRKIRPSLSLNASIAVYKAMFSSYIDYTFLFTYMLSKKI